MNKILDDFLQKTKNCIASYRNGFITQYEAWTLYNEMETAFCDAMIEAIKKENYIGGTKLC